MEHKNGSIVLVLVLVAALGVGIFFFVSTKGKNDAIGGAVNSIEGLAKQATDWTGKLATPIVGGIGSILGGVGSGLKAAGQIPGQVISGVGTAAKGAFVTAPVAVTKAVVGGAKDIANVPVTAAKDVGHAAVSGVKKLVSWL